MDHGPLRPPMAEHTSISTQEKVPICEDVEFCLKMIFRQSKSYLLHVVRAVKPPRLT